MGKAYLSAKQRRTLKLERTRETKRKIAQAKEESLWQNEPFLAMERKVAAIKLTKEEEDEKNARAAAAGPPSASTNGIDVEVDAADIDEGTVGSRTGTNYAHKKYEANLKKAKKPQVLKTGRMKKKQARKHELAVQRVGKQSAKIRKFEGKQESRKQAKEEWVNEG